MCQWHANERRSHLPIRSVLPVCHWQTAPEPAGETAGAAPPFVQRCAPRCAQCAAKKPCQPKTAKRFFGGPGSHGPSGQAKERTRILPVRRGSFCPACRAIWRAGRSCGSLPLLCWLLCPVPVFPLYIVRAGFLPCFHPSLPNFFLSNFFSFVAHAATGTPFSFRKENRGKEPRGGAIGAPFEPPFQRPAANLPFPRAAGRLKRPFRPQTAGR